jgi:MarR family transcriptional regulator, transcriptional regulator for hemolysin
MSTTKEPYEPLGVVFALLAKHYVGAVSEKLKHLEIERYWYVILKIHEQKKPITQKELGNLINLDKTYMVRIVDYLTKKDYVVRKQNLEDRREYFIELTPNAKMAIPDIKAAFESINLSALSGINKDQLTCLEHCLKTIDSNLQDLPSTSININFKKNASK